MSIAYSYLLIWIDLCVDRMVKCKHAGKTTCFSTCLQRVCVVR